jgi:hypothetical protein
MAEREYRLRGGECQSSGGLNGARDGAFGGIGKPLSEKHRRPQENPMINALGESHPSAKSALGWGTRLQWKSYCLHGLGRLRE